MSRYLCSYIGHEEPGRLSEEFEGSFQEVIYLNLFIGDNDLFRCLLQEFMKISAGVSDKRSRETETSSLLCQTTGLIETSETLGPV